MSPQRAAEARRAWEQSGATWTHYTKSIRIGSYFYEAHEGHDACSGDCLFVTCEDEIIDVLPRLLGWSAAGGAHDAPSPGGESKPGMNENP